MSNKSTGRVRELSDSFISQYPVKDVGGIGRIEGHCAGGPGAVLGQFWHVSALSPESLSVSRSTHTHTHFDIYIYILSAETVELYRKGPGRSESVEMVENIQTQGRN